MGLDGVTGGNGGWMGLKTGAEIEGLKMIEEGFSLRSWTMLGGRWGRHWMSIDRVRWVEGDRL